MTKTLMTFIGEGAMKLYAPKTNTKQFFDDLFDTTHPHPFNDRVRMIGDVGVHMSPSMDGSVHMHDIFNLW